MSLYQKIVDHKEKISLVGYIKLLLNNEQSTINGDGKQSRDFTYIVNAIEVNFKDLSF